MTDEKLLMSEAANLYYKKNLTQQEIASLMGLTRQTVSKLLSDAVRENIVEITIHNPEITRNNLSGKICEKYGIKEAVICSVSNDNEELRRLMTVKSAAEYLVPLFKLGGQNIAVSWGRTVKALIEEMPETATENNTVFPLFGATDNVEEYFLSNSLARGMADKFSATLKYAWFPYLPEKQTDAELFKKTSYYEGIKELWDNIDIAVVGIGNTDILRLFESNFNRPKTENEIIGDIATHFFSQDGKLVELFTNSLCASAENIKKAGKTVAIACSDNKIKAISGALKTGLIDILVTDEYTAEKLI